MGQAFSQRIRFAGKGSYAFDVPFVFNTELIGTDEFAMNQP